MAGIWNEIPLSPQAQSLNVTMAGVSYYLTFTYRNCTEGGWFLDIADQNQNPLVQGIPLVTGCDLVACYPDKKFGFSLIVLTYNDSAAPPTFANLGVDSHVYFGVVS